MGRLSMEDAVSPCGRAGAGRARFNTRLSLCDRSHCHARPGSQYYAHDGGKGVSGHYMMVLLLFVPSSLSTGWGEMAETPR